MGKFYTARFGCLALALFLIVGSNSTAKAQNFLFKHPRQGEFKLKKNDRFDFSNTQHFSGSGMLAIAYYDLLKKTHVGHPKLMAAVLATGTGLLKELEDGYREGWGMKDVLSNEIGIVAFLLLDNYTNYTLTLKQVISGPNDYGVGLRFFRTADFTMLKASLGVYMAYNNRRETWVGLDSNFKIYQNLEFNLGASMVNLSNPNKFYFKPNFGFGIILF